MKNLFIAFLSLVVAFVAGEFALRLTLDEVNYMVPIIERDPVLGHVIAPGTGGHDAWGFRNIELPQSADVVAIGDSMTYGYSATASQSWPSQLASLSGLQVYNLGLGGYGMVQYHHLFNDRALSLDPKVVLISIYLGNDLIDTYRGATGFDYVEGLERGETDGRFLGSFRVWMSKHVLTWQVLKHELEDVVNILRAAESSEAERPGLYHMDHPVLRTAFLPSCCYQALNPDNPEIKRGLEIIFEKLEAIKSTCGEQAIDCKVLLVPTKESVLWPVAKDILSGDALTEVGRLVTAEAAMAKVLATKLDEIGLPYLDLLAPMQGRAQTESLYLANDDGHPNAKGYGVIAQVVLEWLQGSKAMVSRKATSS